MENNIDGRRNIQSVERALSMLKFIGDSNNSAGLTAISSGLGLSHSTTHNLLRTLKQCGFVTQSGHGEKYSLGLEIMELAKCIEQNLSVNFVAHGALENLSQKYNESVHLSILSDGESVYVDKIETTHPTRLMSYIGKSNPAHTTAVGKILLSGLQEAQVDDIINRKGLVRKTATTITDPKRLKSALRLIEKQGYALDDGEYEAGAWCAAAPVRDRSGAIVAAISISFPANRIDGFDKSEVIRDVIDSAGGISRQLGY